MLLMVCAIFTALAAFAVTAALKAARVEDMIGDVFSPWLEYPSDEATASNPVRTRSHHDRASQQGPRGAGAVLTDVTAMAAQPGSSREVRRG